MGGRGGRSASPSSGELHVVAGPIAGERQGKTAENALAESKGGMEGDGMGVGKKVGGDSAEGGATGVEEGGIRDEGLKGRRRLRRATRMREREGKTEREAE